MQTLASCPSLAGVIAGAGEHLFNIFSTEFFVIIVRKGLVNKEHIHIINVRVSSSLLISEFTTAL